MNRPEAFEFLHRLAVDNFSSSEESDAGENDEQDYVISDYESEDDELFVNDYDTEMAEPTATFVSKNGQ
jgi:hypothetical protein